MAMDWTRLLNPERLRRPADKPKTFKLSAFAEDQDVICFSQPFRRLQAKTQVHPLAENDHVRTRLIHSIEVGCIGQALGAMIGAELTKRHGLSVTQDDYGAVVEAACLAHDIGHPPFGHAGEYAIREWFKKRVAGRQEFTDLSEPQRQDLLQHEGNAQSFRILTQIENARGNGGLQLTYATLGAGMKYPWGVDADRNVNKKFGFFQSERDYAGEIAERLGLIPVPGGGWYRHPLAYVVEAADDICYAIIDLEDGIEMGSFGFAEFENLLKPFLHVGEDDSAEYGLVAETEPQKISYLRSRAIGALVEECVREFLDNEENLLSGTYEGNLLKHVPHGDVIRKAKEIGLKRVFEHERKQYAEIAAFEIIEGLLTEFTAAHLDVKTNGGDASFKSRRMHRLMGEMGPSPDMNTYESLMRISDFVSGMTDRYAVGMFKQVKGIALGGLTPAPHKP